MRVCMYVNIDHCKGLIQGVFKKYKHWSSIYLKISGQLMKR